MSLTCIAVKDDRHQNITSSVVLKRGLEEPWASERVTSFINSLRCKEITLKSDTEPAVIAFRNRLAENCKAEVTLDVVKGDEPSNGFVVARCHQNHHVPCGELHARRTSRRLSNLAVVGGARGEQFVQVPEGSRRSDAIRIIAWKEAYTRICTIRRQGAGKTDFIKTVEQNESQIQVRNVAVSEKQQC